MISFNRCKQVSAAAAGVFAFLSAAAAADNSSFSFVVIGDTPYAKADRAMLKGALVKIHESDTPFVIHLGDYKGGRQPCEKIHDQRFADLLDALKPLPVFYTPGDNEWTDCDRNKDKITGKRYSDLDRLAFIRTEFFASPPETPAAWMYERQNEQVENATWVYEGVRFLTLHITGTNNGRDWVTGDTLERASAATTLRDRANITWLSNGFEKATEEGARAVVIAMQADVTDVDDRPVDVMCEDVAASDKHQCDAFTEFRFALRDAATTFDKPVLLIHGDTAPFLMTQEMSGEEAPTLWRLNAAGDAGIGRFGQPYGVRDVTMVTIAPSSDEVFSAIGLTTGKAPKRAGD